MLNVGRREDWIGVHYVDALTLEVVEAPVKRTRATADFLIAFDRRGAPRLIPAKCPHRGLPLLKFARRGSEPGTIRCTAHGYAFDLESGHCVATDACGGGDLTLRCLPLEQNADGTWQAKIAADEEEQTSPGMARESLR
jgi:nitrite reductase/ring-hydroxylating ferredoxin subunit